MTVPDCCPNCGTDGFDVAMPCGTCGHFRLGRLRVVNGGTSLSVISLRTEVGKPLLSQWVGADEAKYAEAVQYAFIPDRELGWTIVASAGCRNETFLDGISLNPGTPRQIVSGMSVTIGLSRARIYLEIDRSEPS